MRYVICHYHIFKNSGTTFDALLSENYGEKHICFDGPFPFFSIDQEQLFRIITRKINVVAFSSHQIRLPVPVALDFLILPVVFIRHPLLRIQSIYRFKRKTYDGTEVSKMAREKSFDEWVSCCFSDERVITHVSNGQTSMLGGAYREKPLSRRVSTGMEYDVHQAIRNLQNIQLLARTEYFDNDVSRFPKILSEYGVDFKIKNIKPQNTTSSDHDRSVKERVEKLELSLSDENRRRLWDANDQDLLIYDHATKIIECD